MYLTGELPGPGTTLVRSGRRGQILFLPIASVSMNQNALPHNERYVSVARQRSARVHHGFT